MNIDLPCVGARLVRARDAALSIQGADKSALSRRNPSCRGGPWSALEGRSKLRPYCLLVFLFCVGVVRAHGPGFHADIEYGQAAGEKLLLDVSVPEGEGPFPVAILVHGGGWSGGDKAATEGGAGIAPWFTALTKANYVWFSINYRLAPKHRWPACLDDVQTAIRWVKANAANYRGDPARIALLGHSAGGQLVCQVATVVDDSVRVQAVVGFAPVTNHEQELPVRGGLSTSLQNLLDRPKEVTPESLGLIRVLSPLNHVRPGLPPFLLIHGDADKTVPIQQSYDFQARLKANGVECDLQILPGAGHRLSDWDKVAPGYQAQFIAWLDRHLRPEAASTRP